MREDHSEERKFIHDITNPLAAAGLNLGFVQKQLEKVDGLDPKIIERLKKVVTALERVEDSIRLRRQILVDREKAA